MYQEAGINLHPDFVLAQKRKIARLDAEGYIAAQRKMALRTMQERGVPEWVREIIFRSADEANVPADEVLGESRRKPVIPARHRAMYLVKAKKPGLSFNQIANWFKRDHTTTIYAIAHYARRNDLPPLTTSKGRR